MYLNYTSILKNIYHPPYPLQSILLCRTPHCPGLFLLLQQLRSFWTPPLDKASIASENGIGGETVPLSQTSDRPTSCVSLAAQNVLQTNTDRIRVTCSFCALSFFLSRTKSSLLPSDPASAPACCPPPGVPVTRSPPVTAVWVLLRTQLSRANGFGHRSPAPSDAPFQELRRTFFGAALNKTDSQIQIFRKHKRLGR